MDHKLYDSDLKLMNVLWAEGAMSAQQLAARLTAQVGWGKTTTYTMIKKCIDKGFIERTEPGFLCRPLMSREDAQHSQAEDLIDRLFDGSPDMLVASLLSRRKPDAAQIEKLRKLIDNLK
jgi:predicted transcriptional regulator